MPQNKRSESLKKWFSDYESDHTNERNKQTHFVGIPLIVLSILALLRHNAIGPSNVALLVVVALTGFVFAHDRKLSGFFFAAMFMLYVFSFFVSPKLAWILFVAGWGLQFLGHYKFEKRSPAFFKNLLHLLIGPMWIVAKVTRLR